ncbi:TonB-dependent receptor [Sphingomonas sp. CGMCC 1.13654]|uniref:TonB-dependent receptor n=1 Tax=Sphingomonas chungangi TaxID=2683589 RepID=A0A838LA10_9SPHN|nr:TonB-dependent receptor [Sphingomonas chungangi]MBA2935730.1 TonB-dependent receptor [Sphingomonas chungangi]MVW54420.1 TonB-dependent receptor [Sphingomonas chungangi]
MRGFGQIKGMLLSGVTGAMLMAGGAHAQAEAPTPTVSDAAPADIIVTAQKRSERLQDVPASISVVTATDLTKRGVTRFQDYASRIPGLSLTSARTGNTQITLRGITTGSSQPGSTTGFYVDEAPVGSVNAYTGGNGITPDLDPSDIGQIEVLKGPQGTLYGAGAVGGLLKFTTVPTDLEHFSGRASAGITSVDHGDLGYSGRATINIPLVTDQLGLHVSGFYRRDPGYIDNINPRVGKDDINDAKVRGGRAMLSMKFAPNVRLDLSAILQDTATDGTNTEDVDAATFKPIYGDLKQNRYAPETGYMRLRLYNATWHADFGKLNLVSSTTYQRIYYRELGDATNSYAAFLTQNATLINLVTGLVVPPNLGMSVNTIKHTDRWSEEARASMNDVGGLLDLQGGFYWTHESDINKIPNIDYFSTTTGAPINSLPPFAIASIDSTYDEYSFFGNARLHIGDKFDVLGGVRYSHDHQTYAQDYSGLLIALTAGKPQILADGVEKHNVVTWMATPRFKFSDDEMLYGRVATGYRPGGPNPAPPTGGVPLTFDPDKLTQYEVGFKGQTADRKITVDAALFYTDWDHIQIQTSKGGFNYLVNGGKARSKGGELTLGYHPIAGLTLGVNLAYTDAKLASAAPAAGGIKGDRLPYVPHWTGSLSADYAIPLNDSTKLTFGATGSYVGNRIDDYTGKTSAGTQHYGRTLRHYATVDLRAGLDFGQWTLSAFARNLTDKRAIIVDGYEGLAPTTTAGQPYAASVITPRTIGAEAAIRF